MIDETRLRQRFEAVRGQLDERGLRLMAAAEARAAGYGGIAAVARATGTPACRPPSTHRRRLGLDRGRQRTSQLDREPYDGLGALGCGGPLGPPRRWLRRLRGLPASEA